MGVARPAAKGQNITLVSSNGIPVEDFTSPDVERVRTAVNKRLDQPRVMHGAQDHFADFPKGGSTAFLPNGLVWELKDEESVRAFYALMNRQTRAGTYSSSGK